MMEAQDNFKSKPTNIAYLNNAKAETKAPPSHINGIIESRKQQEESIMSQETYTKSEIDLKFDKISTDVQHSSEKSDLKFDALTKQVDLKFDNFENKLENLFANLKVDLANEKIESLEQARKDKRELILWSIGTAVAILGILIPLILNK
ncbi:hypothetical protein ACVRZR_06185 [Streptococcus entericus]|uniref:hypothetical protein n=1 Tax=Streptococcus entericus TaxID=155680 RepID=UPI0003740470|nr:hypothetical protein [Streptococcus entericus]